MGDSRQEGSPLTGSGHDLSPLLGVGDAVGVAPEGAQLIASGLSTEVAETILQFRQAGKAGKFICIAHFIHSGNSKCFT